MEPLILPACRETSTLSLAAMVTTDLTGGLGNDSCLEIPVMTLLRLLLFLV
ncbi:MAG: hypothetical protein IPP22_14820 [Nitrosomonas sp.]|nr:hypothetical protein [Nitrosomonas sp.]